MRLTFLGGADEVGASCTLVEIGGRRLVVDCGVRTSGSVSDTLPDLALLQEVAGAGGIDGVILTHAHLDHTGALGVLCPAFPLAPVYMTPATLQMASVMLQDALKVMELQCRASSAVPLYGPEAIERVFANARAVPMGQTVELFGGDVRMQFGPAGHILGAAWCLLEGEDGTALMTGDISITDQMTIPGMMVPQVEPDVVVVESTYGGRLHANRTLEHNRLIAQVQEILESDGNVLFPAFAVGRAQEVILILAQAMEKKLLPEAPIYVDGLVRPICRVYAAHPELATPWFRKRIEQHAHPFFVPGGTVRPVGDPREREEIGRGGSSVIVASSGMLTGGPSQLYARMLAEQPRSLIAITGYQDEESPGRHIQELARQGGGKLKLGEETVELGCRVATYSLSAHADTGQILGLLSALRPRHTALVHGDGGARQALKGALEGAGHSRVHLPVIGSTLEVKGKPGRTLKRRATALLPQRPAAPAETPLERPTLMTVAEALRVRDGQDMSYTVQDILVAAGRVQEALEDEALALAREAILGAPDLFRRDKHRPYLFRVVAPASKKAPVVVLGPNAVALDEAPQSRKAKRTALNRQAQELHETLQRVFADDPTYYGRHVMMSQQRMELHFHFPGPAQARHAERLKALAAETGWGFTIRTTPHHQALQDAALEVLPAGWTLAGRPAVRPEPPMVHLPVRAEDFEAAPDLAAAAHRAFRERTGFQLLFDPIQGIPAATDSVRVKAGAPRPTSALLAAEDAPPSQRPPQALRMEFNRARALVLEAFKGQPHEVYKVSQAGEALELAFISPQVGQRYEATLRELEQALGWTLRVRPQADQKRISDMAVALLPVGTMLRQRPGYHPDTFALRIKLKTSLGAEVRRRVEEAFVEATGFQIVWEL